MDIQKSTMHSGETLILDVSEGKLKLQFLYNKESNTWEIVPYINNSAPLEPINMKCEEGCEVIDVRPLFDTYLYRISNALLKKSWINRFLDSKFCTLLTNLSIRILNTFHKSKPSISNDSSTTELNNYYISSINITQADGSHLQFKFDSNLKPSLAKLSPEESGLIVSVDTEPVPEIENVSQEMFLASSTTEIDDNSRDVPTVSIPISELRKAIESSRLNGPQPHITTNGNGDLIPNDQLHDDD